MRAVTGSVRHSERINLSKAAVVLSQFAASAGEPSAARDYVRRASFAVEELLQLGLGLGLDKEETTKKKGRRSFGQEMEESGFESTGEVVDSVKKRRRSKK